MPAHAIHVDDKKLVICRAFLVYKRNAQRFKYLKRHIPNLEESSMSLIKNLFNKMKRLKDPVYLSAESELNVEIPLNEGVDLNTQLEECDLQLKKTEKLMQSLRKRRVELFFMSNTSLPSCGLCRTSSNTNPTLLHCGHFFCGPCLLNHLCKPNHTNEAPTCPTCRKSLGGIGKVTCLPVDVTAGDIYRINVDKRRRMN